MEVFLRPLGARYDGIMRRIDEQIIGPFQEYIQGENELAPVTRQSMAHICQQLESMQADIRRVQAGFTQILTATPGVPDDDWQPPSCIWADYFLPRESQEGLCLGGDLLREYEQLPQDRREQCDAALMRLRVSAALVRRSEDYQFMLRGAVGTLESDRVELERLASLPLAIARPGEPPAQGLPDLRQEWIQLLQEQEQQLAAMQERVSVLRERTVRALDDETQRLGLLRRVVEGPILRPQPDFYL